jgi:uncharacterized protein
MTTTARRPSAKPQSRQEVRTFATRLEARDLGGLQFRLDGYASLTETPYDMGSYTETIQRGAFGATLASRPDVQLLVNHLGLPLARSTIPAGQVGHLDLSEDSKGLHFAAQLDRDDPDAQSVMRKVGTGLMDQCSFSFKVVRQRWSADRSQRDIHEVSLDRADVSVVNQGASPTTSVQARSNGATRRFPSQLRYYQAITRLGALDLTAEERQRIINDPVVRAAADRHGNLSFWQAVTHSYRNGRT